MIRGVSLESMKARASFPASPSRSVRIILLSFYSGTILHFFQTVHQDPFSFAQAR